jgi:hypothetical protein
MKRWSRTVGVLEIETRLIKRKAKKGCRWSLMLKGMSAYGLYYFGLFLFYFCIARKSDKSFNEININLYLNDLFILT